MIRQIRPRALDARIFCCPRKQTSSLCRFNSTIGAQSSNAQPTKARSRFGQVVGYSVFGIVFAGVGFFVGIGPVLPSLLEALAPRPDQDTITAYKPEDERAAAINEGINKHPLAVELRQRPEMTESRPHLKYADGLRKHNLTGGTLLGPGRLTVPPVMWTEEGGKSLVSIMHLGTDMCGHPGIVHGGLLATLLDEGLARCCFDAVPNKVAMTAKLEINYRKPTTAGQYVVLRAETKKVEGRKAWVEGRIETLVGDGQTPIVLVEASGLFVSPKSTFASILARLNVT